MEGTHRKTAYSTSPSADTDNIRYIIKDKKFYSERYKFRIFMMKSSKEWVQADIEQLINNNVSESLELDYKASTSLLKTDRAKKEISKDVSAFANSSGGVLIYGVVENDQRVASKIDTGSNPLEISKEWLEQVISSGVHPRIEGLHINQIELEKSDPRRVLYVVTIPQAMTRAPHQASDNRYYKRFNFESVSMEDYEVKDVLRRATSPDLYFIMSFNSGKEASINLDLSQVFEIDIIVENESIEPANHAVMSIFIDSRLKVIASGRFNEISKKTSNEEESISIRVLNFNWIVPSMMPIFKEYRFKVTDEPLKLELPKTDSVDVNGDAKYVIGWQICAPGMKNISLGTLTLSNGKLILDVPKKFSLDELNILNLYNSSI
jgi:Putative DNA-binding domain